ncbi:hypothetical protein R6242_04000 [Iodobacter sp. CM08]|uniref:hypothetical protein n=1 Tax=Iodobacter sp. CM08 TaxID=3085902 RepID=UPI002982B86C|nr:hypothetical protein [Iodobacter sp. CM08]MDW5415732.1 hypothetical protein [Iodobacter sp. CM08]
MDLIHEEILLAAARMAILDEMTAEETIAIIFRAIDHEMMGPDGQSFNPARIAGVGTAIYAAMFDYPFSLIEVPNDGLFWRAKIPKHGFSAPFEQLLNAGKSRAALCREEQKKRLAMF